MKAIILTAIVALALVSCEKPSSEVESKLSQLEKKAAEAVERQQQLEAELAEQKILAERDAIERERALIEQERMAMEEMQNAESAAAANELERRQAELMERERKIFETQRELDSREQEITGLENQFSERELELAGREPLDALPPIEKNYVSGPTGDYNNFYEPLGAYGSWFQTRDYGYVYQPSVVRDSSWRPYTRGRWAFTNQGWTWVSNEPFGWACYHYGRWALLRNVGWVWVPGSEWAPAWVTWRESPGHIGWAPLPPETLGWSGHSWDSSVESRFVIDSGWFSFVSYNFFGNDIRSHCLPISQNIVIYSNTTNITHYVVRDRRVFVGGPRYRNVCDRIGRNFPIHRLRLDQSPDFGRGGRRLNSQFSGNELQVVAPRMDADWNRALRPSRVSRDLGDVVVDRSKELPEDVRKQYRDRRNEEDNKAQVLVSKAGGRESFEKERKNRLEKGREEVASNEPNRRTSREPRKDTVNEPESLQQPPAIDSPKPQNDQKQRPNDRGSKRPVTETPTVPNPEIPAIPDTRTPTVPNPEIPAVTDTPTSTVPNPEIPAIPDTRTPTLPGRRAPTVPIAGDDPSVSDPRLPNVDLKENLKEESKSKRLPRGVVPTPPVIENNPGGNREGEPSTRRPRTNLNETPNRPQLPPNRDADLQSEADKKAARETRQQQEAVREEQLRSERALKLQQEESARLQRMEALKTQQKQEQLEQVQRQQQEQQEKLNDQLEQKDRAREQKEQGEKLRELQNKQELDRKEQQERLRAQQEQREQAREQQDKLREQQAQQELVRKQQELLRAQQEQQERLRAQQEQQERARAQQEQQERSRRQQEDTQRQMQEQQERQRSQQEQQERARAQQEQQERSRSQQEDTQQRTRR